MSDSKTLPMQMAVLRGCLSSPLGLSEALRNLSDEHFDDERCLTAFTAIREMHLGGYEVGPQELETYLDTEKGFAEPSEFVQAVWAITPASNPSFIIKSLTVLRGRKMAAELGEFLTDPASLAGGMEKVIARINQFTLAFSSMSTERVQTLTEFMQDIDKPRAAPLIVFPGLGELDKHYRFRPGTLNTVGAPPGIGKTALLMQMSINANDQGHDTLTISLEVPDYDLKSRATAVRAGVNAFRMKEGTLMPQEVQHIKAIAETQSARIARFHHIAPSRMMVDAVHAEINKWVAEKNIRAVYLDYCQRLQAPAKFNSREYERVTYVSENLTAIAKSTGIPIIMASATRRKAPGEKEDGPSMHDLRSTGQLEFDSHTIMLLSRDKENKNIMHADLAKNRDGGLMGADLFYDFETQRITPV